MYGMLDVFKLQAYRTILNVHHGVFPMFQLGEFKYERREQNLRVRLVLSLNTASALATA